MKLIIDIPEKIVTAIQNGEDYRYDIHTAIAQGIPYEPKGDLISREALKEEVKTLFCPDGYKIMMLERIDNAPTVAVDEEVERQREKLYQESKKLFDTARMLGVERPQGEWIVVSRNCWKCPYCQELTNEGKNFCPNCGADMRKENDNGKS